MQETRVWSLGGEDDLEKRMATHSRILAWRIPWTEEPWRCKESDTTEQLSFRFSRSYIPVNLDPSVQFSRSVVSDSLRPHESQHARPLCPSPTPGVHSNSCPSSRWCHPAISSSVVPFSSCPQSLPASESFPMRQLFAWGGQSIGVSASASVSINVYLLLLLLLLCTYRVLSILDV